MFAPKADNGKYLFKLINSTPKETGIIEVNSKKADLIISNLIAASFGFVVN
jgi:hypothetical protein